jgi:hypothetical protein
VAASASPVVSAEIRTSSVSIIGIAIIAITVPRSTAGSIDWIIVVAVPGRTGVVVRIVIGITVVPSPIWRDLYAKSTDRIFMIIPSRPLLLSR